MTTKLFGGTIRCALIHAATRYDERQSTKRGYNRYALPQYFARLDQVCEDIAAGTERRAALLKGFNGRLLDCLLTAIGEAKFTREEMLAQSYVYRR